MDDNITTQRGGSLDEIYNPRYVLVNKETGELVDDAQGYGYKSPQAAYSAYAYKTHNKSKQRKKEQQDRKITKWLKESGFDSVLESVGFEILKGSCGPDVKLDSKLVSELLEDIDEKPEYSPAEILKVWKKQKK